jgi:hypothetical protein
MRTKTKFPNGLRRLLVCLPMGLFLLAQAARADLDSLTFMHGDWSGSSFGGSVSESWRFTGGSTMTGVFKAITGDNHEIIEFILIEESDQGVVMRWNHYRPDYSRWEDTVVEHRLVEAAENYAKFQISQTSEKLPTHMIYRRNEDTMRVWVGDLEASDPSGAFELIFTLDP